MRNPACPRTITPTPSSAARTHGDPTVRRLSPVIALLLLPLSAPAARADFTLGDGDRVVWLGSTLVEREQRYGWWELALTTRFPGKKVTSRNLGWSGDTVFGDSHTGYTYTRTGNANGPKGF